MEKFVQKYTFSSYYERCLETERVNGLMNLGQVIKLQKLYVLENGPCAECQSEENLTADHIFPIFFLKAFGYPADRMFRLEWYQVLCVSCNRKKTHRIDWNNPRTYEIINRAKEEKPTFEYAYLKKEHAKEKAQQEFHRNKAEGTPITMYEAHQRHGLTYADKEPIPKGLEFLF